MANVDRSLVFVSEAFLEKISPAALGGDVIAFDTFKACQVLDDLGSDLDLGKIFFGVLHLLGDPGAGLGTFRIFEPAVGIGERDSVDGLGHGFCFGHRRRGQDDSVATFDFGGTFSGESEVGEKEDEEQAERCVGEICERHGASILSLQLDSVPARSGHLLKLILHDGRK